jgi:environmental stress-induced protein Ves
MENTTDSHHTVFVISLWSEMKAGEQLAWRGSIRTIDGKRICFSTLDDLTRLLCELSGWLDSPTKLIEDIRS